MSTEHRAQSTEHRAQSTLLTFKRFALAAGLFVVAVLAALVPAWADGVANR